MLLEEFLTPMNLTQRELAEAIHVPYQRVNETVSYTHLDVYKRQVVERSPGDGAQRGFAH